MKKIICIILIISITLSIATLFISCNNDKAEGRVNIVTTIFPLYDWATNLSKDVDDVNVSLLMNNGVDLHSFQPSVKDIVSITNADIFIYVGGESDKWVEDVIKTSDVKDVTIINLMDVLGQNALEEEIKDGMQTPEEDGEEAYDEHAWLSLKNAKLFVSKIAEALTAVDSSFADNYAYNLTEYISKLDALDNQYEEAISNSTQKTLLFADRFPFRYLVEDYKLDYFAAFVGCSSESNASFETICFLANKVDEFNLNYVIVLESSDKKIAETIINTSKNKNQQILVLNSLQSVTSNDISNGVDYLNIMQKNMETIKVALR